MCGVIGIIGSAEASKEAYLGLLKLQHRGQDAAGILSYDFERHAFGLIKDRGLISSVFAAHPFGRLKGEMSIGHTRYQTVGSDEGENIQPMVTNYPFGIGMVHNGNLVNYHQLASDLKIHKKRHALTNNDLEVIQNILSDELIKRGPSFSYDNLLAATHEVFKECQGGYSVIGMVAEEGMFGLRDPSGIRPLLLGCREENGKKSYSLASESNALRYIGHEIVRDVAPGELIFIDRDGGIKCSGAYQKSFKPCMFEWVYFSNPESILEGRPVYRARHELGKKLSAKVKKLMENGQINPDIVVPVPETSRIAATTLAESIGVPYREVLIKNRYVQRSFILKNQKERRSAVELKLSPVESEIRGKRVLLLDDSIVRGTTSGSIINLMRKAGAKEVYFASSCPPIKNPCYFGIDFPSHAELVAHERDELQIAQHLGAECMIYLDIKDLLLALKVEDACMACLNNQYPVDISSASDFLRHRRSSDLETSKQLELGETLNG